MDDLLADFLTETNESLAELDVALVHLEQVPDDEATLSQIFRLVHTIKGTCGFLGLPRLEHVAHSAENVLGRVRDKLLTVTPDIVTSILSALDRIKLIVSGLGANECEPDGDDTALLAALDTLAADRGSPARQPDEHVGDGLRHAVAESQAASRPAEPTLDDQPPAAKPQPPSAALGNADPATGTGEPHVAGQTIRVGVDVLEDLMTLVSELVLTRNQLLQHARSNDGQSGEINALSVPLQRLSHITSDLQEGVMKTRMQPIGNAWNKLPRLVRDLARDLNKQFELQMHGADTELDRQVLELIKDPLTHMVRNSGDHGLETPAERRAAGKPETGRITLNAFHEGGHIIIEVADDGRGLPVDRIRAKILSKGLATEAELAGMNDEQIQRFIFRAGFSTATEVSAVSGRGVGMDVVKTNIERIGGTIELKSIAGRGTSFTIKIPLTLAIVSALIIESGGERFAIPQISVVELVRAHANAPVAGETDGSDSVIETINGTPVLRLRERLLPLVNLDELLQLGTERRRSDGAALYIVVVQVGALSLGIAVDRVFDTEEIVVKPVAPMLRRIGMFSGNTILGDGSVIMILDPNGIARATGIAGGEVKGLQAKDPSAEGVHAEQRIAMLLFRADGGVPMAVPLALVARLEDIPLDRIELSSGKPVTQYRERLMPLVPLSGALDFQKPRHSVLVFSEGDGGLGRVRCMGLVVDEIVDVVEDVLHIQLSGARAGVLGTAVIAERATDVIDTGYWLTEAHQDWFQNRPATIADAARILVVDDSDFFRQMLVPTLSAAGYVVSSVADAARALRLRDTGAAFDAIISDIEMPGMDGLAFVRALRSEGPWRTLPIIALSGRTGSDEATVALDAGFSDFVEKNERAALLASLQQRLAGRGVIHRQTAVAHAA